MSRPITHLTPGDPAPCELRIAKFRPSAYGVARPRPDPYVLTSTSPVLDLLISLSCLPGAHFVDNALSALPVRHGSVFSGMPLQDKMSSVTFRVPLPSPARHASMLISPTSPLPWTLTIAITRDAEGLALRLAVGSTRTWDMQTSCLCPSVLMSHSLLLDSPFLPVQPDIVLPPAPRAPVHGSSAPAMDGFGGVPPPSRRTMAAQRTSSAARTLVRGPFSVGNHTGAQGQYPNATSFNTQDLMVKPLPAGCRLTARIRFLPLRNRVRLVPDLPYIYDSHWRLRRRQVSAHARARKATPADVISLSRCKDGQTSADTFAGGVAVGAASHAFIKAIEMHPNQSYQEILHNIRIILHPKFSQKPQQLASHRASLFFHSLILFPSSRPSFPRS
ncbi:hypothetical protein B0H14DRAFT_3900597 [Mycena olivaceomarginata]|nr:hypothetical protein B0H14DRAFT_3900597 [Mycena olivaceomarginata]